MNYKAKWRIQADAAVGGEANDNYKKRVYLQWVMIIFYAGHNFVIVSYCGYSSLRLSSTFDSDWFIFST